MAALTLIGCGAVLLLAAAVDLAYDDGAALRLAVAACGVGAVGLVGRRAFALPPQPSTRAAYGAVGAVWLAASAASAAAYLLTGTFERADDALFESVAGFTTTALTVLPDPDGTPHGVLLWRAATQWLGGFAALVVVVGVLPSLGVGGLDVTGAQRPARTLHLLAPHVRSLLRRLALAYLALSSVGVALFLLAGMGPFDAVTYAATTISTGGFGNHARSFAHFDSALVEWFGIGGMVLAGASFTLLWRRLRGLTSSLLGSTELRAYAVLLVVASAAVVAMTTPAGTVPTHEAVRHALFSVASVVSTTGHTVTDWGRFEIGPQVLLLVLVGIGAMSGSTGGGFRIVRLLVVLGAIRREIVRQLHPRSVVVVKIGRVPVEEPLVARIVGYQVLFVLAAAGAILALAASGSDLVTAFSGGISALSTVGPALGDLSPGSTAAALSRGGRGVLMVVMLLGRLEIYPVLVAGAVLLGRRRVLPVRAGTGTRWGRPR